MSVTEEAWIRSLGIFDAWSSSATGISLSVLFDPCSIFILILRILLLRRTRGRSLGTFRNRTDFRMPTLAAQRICYISFIFTGCLCVCGREREYVCMCVWEREREGRNSCLPFLWRGKCIRQSGGKTKERSPVLRHLPKELLKSSPSVCLYAFCKCSLLK